MEHSNPRAPTDDSARRWNDWIDDKGRVFLLYARQMTRSENDAQDVMQDSLIRSWQRTGGDVPDDRLVFATIRRKAIDLGRSIDRRSKREALFAGEEALISQPDYADEDTKTHLISIVAELPSDLREVLVLRIWGSLSFPEISKVVDAPVATATSRYRYALERMRESTLLAELKP